MHQTRPWLQSQSLTLGNGVRKGVFFFSRPFGHHDHHRKKRKQSVNTQMVWVQTNSCLFWFKNSHKVVGVALIKWLVVDVGTQRDIFNCDCCRQTILNVKATPKEGKIHLSGFVRQSIWTTSWCIPLWILQCAHLTAASRILSCSRNAADWCQWTTVLLFTNLQLPNWKYTEFNCDRTKMNSCQCVNFVTVGVWTEFVLSWMLTVEW